MRGSLTCRGIVVSISGKIDSGLTRDRAKLQNAIMSLRPRGIYRTSKDDCPKIDYYQADLNCVLSALLSADLPPLLRTFPRAFFGRYSEPDRRNCARLLWVGSGCSDEPFLHLQRTFPFENLSKYGVAVLAGVSNALSCLLLLPIHVCPCKLCPERLRREGCQ